MFQMLDIGPLELNVNGEKRTVVARPADTLLYALREHLGLTGTKNACETGDCDVCTVLIDGWPVKSCHMLAVEAVGHQVNTIEGIKGSPVQTAFLAKEAFQCGYCTPGYIVTAHALLTLHPDAEDEVINEWLAGNLCRCTGYQEIKEAVLMALGR
ncbi:nicotinate dehydrogenase small FeS subunit [Peptococcaceae bacterium CEB3]|nr:nicotinate dehydrogenase small FeS subunit [Peptococcaceae bacterium CEB3]